jgi:hypothetical protein
MNHTITADLSTLFDQSKNTACNYFMVAKGILINSDIDYTAADVIALAKIMAYDLRTSYILIAAQKIAGVIETSVSEVAEGIDDIRFSMDMYRELIEEREVNAR